MTGIAGERQSCAGLSKKIKDVDKSVGDRIHAIEKKQTYYQTIAAIALALVIGLTVNWFEENLSLRPTPILHGAASVHASKP